MTGSFFDWTPDDGPGQVHDVSSQEGWDRLERRYAPGKPNRQLREVFALAQSHGTASVLEERRYIDLDYRDEHSKFYSTTFRRYPSVAHRLHFFTAPLRADLQNLAQLTTDYVGYSVMKPLPTSPVGRTMLRPPNAADLDGATFCTARDEVHLFGETFVVRAMPFMSQDAQYLRCAHTVQWMVLYHAHLNRGDPRRVPSDIQQASTGGQVLGRQLPSAGLSEPQLLVSLHKLGLSPTRRGLPQAREGSEGESVQSLFGTLCRNINSNFPPIVLSKEHAWVVCGYGRSPDRDGRERIVLYRHDDARGPYQRVEDPWDDVYVPWLIAVTPLPRKLFLEDDRAEMLGTWWLSERARTIDGLRERIDDGRVTFRSYAIEGVTFKMKASRLPGPVARLYRVMHLPRWIWVVELVDCDRRGTQLGSVLGEALIDGTAHRLSTAFDSALLAVHLPGIVMAETPDHEQSQRATYVDPVPYKSGCELGLW